MTRWHDVGPVEDLEREGRLIARAGGREIGVLAVDGVLWAIRNRCPHHGGPLCLGSVRERETGTPGRYEAGDRRVLRCPWHGWEFDLESGRCLDDQSMRVAVYRVETRAGRVLVEAE